MHAAWHGLRWMVMTSKVYELDLHGQKIERIENLEKHKHLRVLDLSENCITTTTNLQNNCDLRELKLYGNEITVIEGLQRLTELCTLYLQHNRIRCIGKGLTGLRKLRVLRLDHNHLEQVAPGEVASLASLVQLDLSYNQLTTVAGLGCLASLEELRLASNRLQALPNVSRCSKLQELDVSCNPVAVESLSTLRKMEQLKILRIESLHITDVASLPVLRSLEELHVASNELQSLKGLPVLYPALEMLDVRRNCLVHFRDLLCLTELCSLTELLVEGNPLCVQCESYRGEVKAHLPYLEVLDGVPVSPGVMSAVPLMRPLTPASVGPSTRQVEHQLMDAELQLETYQSGLAARFELLQATVNAIDSSVLKPAATTALSSRSDRPSSQYSSRARLQKALTFATEHFNPTS